LLLDLLINLLFLLLGGIGKPEGDRVTKDFCKFLETVAIGLGEEEIDRKDAHECETSKYYVVPPAYIGDGSCARCHVCNSRKEVRRGSQCHSARANIGRIDFADVHKRGSVDEETIEKDKAGTSVSLQCNYRASLRVLTRRWRKLQLFALPPKEYR
jgi:hypothetical protein